jgi:hypothetical protein
LGALLAGQIYGESMFLIESGIALLSLLALIAHNRRKKHQIQQKESPNVK